MGKGNDGPTRQKASFLKWLDDIGVEVLAKKLGTHPNTVFHWKAGRCYPRIDQMREIRKLTRGVITCDAIIDGIYSRKR